MAVTLAWQGIYGHEISPPQEEQQLPSQSVGKDFGKAKGRQTHDGMKTGASWCHWSWTVLVWVESQQDWMNISADSADASVHYQDLLGFFSDIRFFSNISPSKFSQPFPDIFQNNYPRFSRFSQNLPRFYRFSCTFFLDFPTIFLQGGVPPIINGL